MVRCTATNALLIEKYYDGINSSQLSSHDSTRYKWNFAKKIDQHELDSIRDHVDTMTNSQKNKKVETGASTSGGRGGGVRRNVGPSLPPSSSGRSGGRYASGTLSGLRKGINRSYIRYGHMDVLTIYFIR
jgi:hypothetical protein